MAGTYIRPKRLAPSPCEQCAQPFYSNDLGSKPRFCGLICANLAKRSTKKRVCTKCHRARERSCFVPRKAGSVTAACVDCYKPRKTRGQVRTTKSYLAPNACNHCKQRFYVQGFLCIAKKRKHCSRDCAIASRTAKTRFCQTCHRTKNPADFDWQPSAKERLKSCRSCEAERARLRSQRIGFMQSLGRCVLSAKGAARKAGKVYELTHDDARELYGSPCVLCGAKGCMFRSMAPEVGFLPGGVEVLCWACSRLVAPGLNDVLTDETIIAHARAIVRHADG